MIAGRTVQTRTLALLATSALAATATAAVARLEAWRDAPASVASPAPALERTGVTWVIDRSRSSLEATAEVFDAVCRASATGAIVELAARPHVRSTSAPCAAGPAPTTPGTDLLAALEAAYATEPREVVVVSDGLDTVWGSDVDARAAAIVSAVDAAHRAGTTTRVFAVGPSADVDRLAELARVGGGAPLGDAVALADHLAGAPREAAR
jgi:hypothetical protein